MIYGSSSDTFIMTRTKPCIIHLLEVQGRRMRGVGQLAGMEAYTLQTTNIIS
jgi:hypothetical protein